MNNFSKITCTTALGMALAAYSPSSFSASNSTTNSSSGVGSVNTNSSNSSTHSSSNTDWNNENKYWTNNYSSRPYYNKGDNYSQYEPAYKYGVDLYNQNPGKPYESLNQDQLRTNWMKANPNSSLNWDRAEKAMRDSYNHIYNNTNSNDSTRP
jgi:hypothetical protein